MTRVLCYRSGFFHTRLMAQGDIEPGAAVNVDVRAKPTRRINGKNDKDQLRNLSTAGGAHTDKKGHSSRYVTPLSVYMICDSTQNPKLSR